MNKFYKLFLLFSFILISGEITFTYSQNSTPSTAQIVFTSVLNASNVSSSDTSDATATAWAILSSDRTKLTYRITYASLTTNLTASHFHRGGQGTSGPVVQPIAFNGNTAEGEWNDIPDSILAYLLKGEIYINIHTANYPGGEIRGQLMPADGIPFVFSPDANQVNSSVNSAATGTGWAILHNINDTLKLSYGLTVAGLTSQLTASHFHIGAAGQNGTVVHPISIVDSSSFGIWSDISDANLLALIRNGLYVNVHSMNYTGGEIRGQVVLAGPISFTASLDGTQEVPSVATNASGTGWFVLSRDSSSIAYQITYANLQGTFSASHFHLAAAGSGGKVVQPITFSGNTAKGVWTNIPDSLIASLLKGNIYTNIHSSAFGTGEIRGQVLLNYGISFTASLDGSQSVSPLPVITSGSGTAWLSLENDMLEFRMTIAGLSSAFSASHFHLGAFGANGGVVEPITITDSLVTAAWVDIDNVNLAALIKENLYINVHTANFPTGEIRGQVIPSDYDYAILTDVEQEGEDLSIPSVYELGQNYPNPFNPLTKINYSVPLNSHVSIKVYDILGNEIITLVNEQKAAGKYQVEFNGSNFASGVYFYQMKVNDKVFTKKLMLLK